MDDAGVDALRDAIRNMHGCESTWVESVPVTETFNGNVVWDGEVQVFVHRDTICRLLVSVGDGCANLLDEKMVDLDCKRLELDELWAYVAKKQRHVKEEDDQSRVGDTWTYVAIDADTKLVPCYRIGKRDAESTNSFR